MEMIAMLGGLGAGPSLENASAAARAALAAINGAPDVAALDAVISGLPNMGLSQTELLTLQAVAMSKREDMLTPFYKRPGFWALVAAAGAVFIFRRQLRTDVSQVRSMFMGL